jgi:hypothetical protein
MEFEKAASDIAKAAETILGGQASPILMSRIQATLEHGMSDLEALQRAVERVKKIIELFVGANEASNVTQHAQTIVDKVRNQGDP